MGKQHRNSRRLNSRADDEKMMRPALEQRCREMGWPPTPVNLMRVRQLEFQDEAGRVIARAYPDHPSSVAETKRAKDRRADLYSAIEHVRRVYARQLRAIDAPSPNARGMSIIMEPARRFESGTDHYSGPVSMPLTDDEEARRARAAWANIKVWLRPFGIAYRIEFVDIVAHARPIRDARRFLDAVDWIHRQLRGEAR